MVAEVLERAERTGADVDEDREQGEAELVLLALELAQPLGVDSALAVGDEHDVAARMADAAQAVEGGAERLLKIGAAAGEVLGEREDLVHVGGVALARVEVEHLQRRLG